MDKTFFTEEMKTILFALLLLVSSIYYASFIEAGIGDGYFSGSRIPRLMILVLLWSSFVRFVVFPLFKKKM